MKIKKSTLRKYIDFLSDLEQAESNSDYVEFNWMLPYDNPPESKGKELFIREMVSPFSYESEGMETVVLPKRLTPQKTLGRRLLNCEKLTICDPYFFFAPKDLTAKQYISQFISTIPLDTLRVLNIVYNSKKQSDVIQELKRQIPSVVSLKLFVDYSLHDRVWIVNDSRAFIVGTSFGSLGKKVAFILDLPFDDFLAFRKHLAKATNNFQN